jgi:hypothetical protein
MVQEVIGRRLCHLTSVLFCSFLASEPSERYCLKRVFMISMLACFAEGVLASWFNDLKVTKRGEQP